MELHALRHAMCNTGRKPVTQKVFLSYFILEYFISKVFLTLTVDKRLIDFKFGLLVQEHDVPAVTKFLEQHSGVVNEYTATVWLVDKEVM